MNRKNNNFVVIVISILFIIFMITSKKQVIESVNFSISIWKDNLFPTLFPFFVVSNILLDYGFINVIGNLLKKPMKYLFKLPKECSFVLGVSLFSGFPSGAKYTVSLLNKNIIDNNTAERLLTFTNYCNPLFILGFIGLFFDTNITIIILISHIISGLLVGIIINKKYKYMDINNQRIISNNISFGSSFQKSIKEGINTLLMLLGIITIFSIFSELINSYLNLPIIYNTILSGILEISQGIKKIILLDISIYFKTILITSIISFGGFSVHLQVTSIISECKIKYKSFLIARILHSILSIILVSILYYFIS